MAAVFARLLEATALELDALGPEQLRPVEIAVIDFWSRASGPMAACGSWGAAEGARAALLHGIFQSMEAMLGDPELGIGSLAADAGISPRYLRRLFAAEGMNFAATPGPAARSLPYRPHKLAPCTARHIGNRVPLGFNDAAHFSRSSASAM